MEQKRPSGSCFREKYHKGCSRQLPANIETTAGTILFGTICAYFLVLDKRAGGRLLIFGNPPPGPYLDPPAY